MSLVVVDPSTVFVSTGPMIPTVVMFDPSSQPLFTGPIRPVPSPRRRGAAPGPGGAGVTYLKQIVPCPDLDSRDLAETIGTIVFDIDEVKEKRRHERARLIAVMIALAMSGADTSGLVASAIALLATPEE